MKKIPWAKILLGIILLIIVLLTVYCFCKINWDEVLPYNARKNENYAGDLIIEVADINVPCVLVFTSEKQAKYVDKPNCASIMPAGSYIEGHETWIIGDHNYQGFSRIERCEIGDTAKFVAKDGTVTLYEVTANFTGHNRHNDLQYEDGTSVIEDNYGGIILYTCMDNPENVRIVFLQPI